VSVMFWHFISLARPAERSSFHFTPFLLFQNSSNCPSGNFRCLLHPLFYYQQLLSLMFRHYITLYTFITTSHICPVFIKESDFEELVACLK
jgi:hypothetical protein